jgi:hypothetical protein
MTVDPKLGQDHKHQIKIEIFWLLFFYHTKQSARQDRELHSYISQTHTIVPSEMRVDILGDTQANITRKRTLKRKHVGEGEFYQLLVHIGCVCMHGRTELISQTLLTLSTVLILGTLRFTNCRRECVGTRAHAHSHPRAQTPYEFVFGGHNHFNGHPPASPNLKSLYLVPALCLNVCVPACVRACGGLVPTCVCTGRPQRLGLWPRGCGFTVCIYVFKFAQLLR